MLEDESLDVLTEVGAADEAGSMCINNNYTCLYCSLRGRIKATTHTLDCIIALHVLYSCIECSL